MIARAIRSYHQGRVSSNLGHTIGVGPFSIMESSAKARESGDMPSKENVEIQML